MMNTSGNLSSIRIWRKNRRSYKRCSRPMIREESEESDNNELNAQVDKVVELENNIEDFEKAVSGCQANMGKDLEEEQKKSQEMQSSNDKLEESKESDNNVLNTQVDKVVELENNIEDFEKAVSGCQTNMGKVFEEMKRKIQELQSANDELREIKEKQQIELEESKIALKAQLEKAEYRENKLMNLEKVVIGKDEYGVQKLIEQFGKLIEEITCTICQDVVRSEVVHCEGGHLLCTKCLGEVECCPICGDEFSDSLCSLMCRILEILPTRCKHSNCPTIILDGEEDKDHEIYCDLRPTDCKWCTWKGRGKDFSDHINNYHPDLESGKKIENFDPEEPISQFLLSAEGPLKFWINIRNKPEEKLLIFIHIPIPTGKPDLDTFITYHFKSTDLKIESESKINMKPDIYDEKEYSFAIPHAILHNFIDDEGDLEFDFTVKYKPTLNKSSSSD